MANGVPLVQSVLSFPGFRNACLSKAHLSRILPLARPGGPPTALLGPPARAPLAVLLSVRRAERERRKQKFAAAAADAAAAAAAATAATQPTSFDAFLPTATGRACTSCLYLRVPRHFFSTRTLSDSSSGPPAGAASAAATGGTPVEPGGPPTAAPCGGPPEAASVTFDLSRIEGTENARDGQLALVFTCCKCSTRAAKKFSKVAYTQGVVIVRCPGCKNLHLVADRLRWFGEEESDVESILAAKGEKVIKDLTAAHLLEIDA